MAKKAILHLWMGELLSVPEIARRSGVSEQALRTRLRKGEPIEVAATKKPMVKRVTAYDWVDPRLKTKK